MQKIGAYLLERRDGMFDRTARHTEASTLRAAIWEWVRRKGAPCGVEAGEYTAEDGTRATFAGSQAEDGDASWSMVRLEELAHGRRFAASVSVTTMPNVVVVYASLEAGSDASQVTNLDVDPKCPRVIRALLKMPGNWYHRASRIRPTLQRVRGFDDGDELALELLSPERTLPWLVVSEVEQTVAIDSLDSALAYDLVGLANVARVDADATWALTDRLGKAHSVYDGAIRIYWPRLADGDDPFRHPLWTAQRLRAAGRDASSRFRRQVRHLMMRASALSVVRPRQIDDIRRNADRRAQEAQRSHASSVSDFEQLAESYLADNDQLREDNLVLSERIAELRAQIATLEGERAALLVRIDNAEVQLRYRGTTESIPPEKESEAPADEGAPAQGEVRFYKKISSNPSRDVMRRVADCGCNSWQSGHKGDKAKKGISKLENGRNDWSTIQHCGRCTGGGVWRVVW